MDTKNCNSCRQQKPLDEFYTGRAQCKSCVVTQVTTRQKNNPQYLKYQAQYREKNKDRMKAAHKKYVEKNRGLINFLNSRRKKRIKERTPSWLSSSDIAQIKEIYNQAAELSQQTDKLYHVDHIIPLKGELVSGLHVPSNLQILEASENIRKSNQLKSHDL
jgi:uncharacterized Zn finger protein (UPF0148 family)